MSKRRVPTPADTKFSKAVNKAMRDESSVTINGICIYPPLTRSTFRLKANYNGRTKELSGGATIDSAYSAFCTLEQWLKEQQTSMFNIPENQDNLLATVLTGYINQGGGNYAWCQRTIDDRTRDFRGLIELAQLQNITCAEFTIEHIRRYVNNSAGTSERGKHLIRQVKTFLEWGYKSGHFTSEQTLMAKRVQWTAKPDSGYRSQPTRREQSERIAGHSSHDGGQVPTHDQVNDFALACQQYYQYGQGLIHVAANTGLRAGELVMLTASQSVAKQRRGNYIDLDQMLIIVKLQKADTPSEYSKPTKNGKIRSVVIPPVAMVATGFDVQQWLTQRCLQALKEQEEGKNPLALIFPNAHGGIFDVNNLGSRIVRRAADYLGWRMKQYITTRGAQRAMRRFTLHSMRDRFATTAVDEWNYTESELLDQGSWADRQTVQKYYLGTTDQTLESVKHKHRIGDHNA